MSDALSTTVARLFAAHCTPAVLRAAEDGHWPDALWHACTEAGLHLALIDRGDHSLDVSASEAFGVARAAGAHAAPIPLVETMLANWLLAHCDREPRSEPTVIADAGLRRVPWGQRAGVIMCGSKLSVFEPNELATARAGTNLAKEPRDDLTRSTPSREPFARPDGVTDLRLRAAAAALRVAQMAGALESIAAMTIEYTTQRVQFGKPIAKFQAVQQSAAILAEQAAAAGAAADMAAEAFANGIDVNAIAAAKTFAGEAASIGAGLAHQLHGAIGFSREYALHHRTQRLWSWRDEYGNDTEWAALLGSHLARAGGDRLWTEITAL